MQEEICVYVSVAWIPPLRHSAVAVPETGTETECVIFRDHADSEDPEFNCQLQYILSAKKRI